MVGAMSISFPIVSIYFRYWQFREPEKCFLFSGRNVIFANGSMTGAGY